MRVAILYYPMLFQRTGGLQVQVLETCHALQNAGIDAVLFDYRKDRLKEFDIAHVFSAINGVHRIVEQAKNEGLPVVLSTVLHPPWSRSSEVKARAISRAASKLSGWSLSTSHQEIHICLSSADAVIALGKSEQNMLIDSYGIHERKVHIVPNGIKQAFFEANDKAFRNRYNIYGPYALNVASVSPYKNQMTALRALKEKIPLVVFGPCANEHQDYLQEMKEFGGEWFHYFGVVDNDDPVLPSSYAGASLFILPSKSEVQPISALEALAADCPVIITKNHSLDMLTAPNTLNEVEPNDVNAIAKYASAILTKPHTKGHFRDQVRELSWKKTAEQICGIYENIQNPRQTN